MPAGVGRGRVSRAGIELVRRRRLLLANLTGDPVAVNVKGVNADWRVRRLEYLRLTLVEPSSFWSKPSEPVRTGEGGSRLTLSGYEIAVMQPEAGVG